MALNSSGAISLAGTTTGESVAVELSQSATGQISLNDTNVRTLAGVASGAIVMPTNFWGKSSFAGVTGIYMTLAKGGGANKIAYGNGYVIAGTQTLSNLIYYSSDNGQIWGTIAFPINYNILSIFADANAWYFIVRIQTSSSAFSHSTYRCPFTSTITTVNNWVDTLTDTYFRTTLINNIWIYHLGNVSSMYYKTAYNGTWATCNVGSPVATYNIYNYGQGSQPTKFADIASNGSNLLMMGKTDIGGTSTVYVLISTDNGANWTETNTGITVNSTYGIYVYNVQFDTVSNKFYAVAQHSTNGGELRLVSTTSSGTSWTLYDATAVYFNQPIKLINDGTNPYWIGGGSRIQKCPANSTGAYSIIYDNITNLSAIVKAGNNVVTVGEGSFAGTGITLNTWFSTTSGQPFQYVQAYWGTSQSYLATSSIGFFSAFAGYYNTGSLDAGNGVHFSNNNGTSWSTYTFSGDVGATGVVASNTAAVLYTGTGTYRRSTNGTTWSAVALPTLDRSRTVIALGFSSGLMVSYGSNVGGYAYSTNSGASWTNSSIGAGYTILCGCAIGTTITLFSYNASGVMYYHKTTNGTSWTTAAIGGGLGTYLDWYGISALPTSVIVITGSGYGGKIWVSTDGGVNFTEYTCNGGAYGFFNQQLCVGGNIKLCSDGTYFVGIAYTDTGYQTRSIYKSTDGLNYTKGGCGNAQAINLAGVLYKTGETPSLTNCNYVAAYGNGGNKPEVTAVGYLTS